MSKQVKKQARKIGKFFRAVTGKVTSKSQKQCPRCCTIAHGRVEIKDVFGLRIDHDREIAQSYCKKCRSEKA